MNCWLPKKFWWHALMASATLRSRTTAEMERSLEPWAMATMLMEAWAREVKKRAAIPLLVRIPSPMREMMARSLMISSGSSSWFLNSSSNSRSSTLRVLSLS